MSQLTFATEGQAAVLAAQESVAKKARELKAEFESGAKATKSWDAEMAKMARTSESALRSVQTEQEKIVKQIDDIQAAVKNGLYDGREQEAEESIARLRQKWVDVDAATLSAKDKAREYAAQQDQIKSKAESALGSVQTELEAIEQQIADLEAAAKEGLIKPEESEKGITRLQDKLSALKNSADASAAGITGALGRAFSPVVIAKYVGSVAGIGAAIKAVKSEFDDLQTAVDKRQAAFLEPKGRADQLREKVESARDKVYAQQTESAESAEALAQARRGASRQEVERQHELRQQIADAQENLARAHEDRTKAQSNRAEDIEAAQLRLERAQEDLSRAKTPSARLGATRKVVDAEGGLNKLREEVSGNTDRRIKDIERDLVRMKSELGKRPDVEQLANEQAAFEKSRSALTAVEREYALAKDEDRRFRDTPEFQRSQRIGQRIQSRKRMFRRIAQTGDEDELSMEEIEQVIDDLRDIGRAELATRIELWAARKSGGIVTPEEERELSRRRIEEIEAPSKPRTFSRSGGVYGFQPEGDVVTIPAERELTKQQAEIIQILRDSLIEHRRSNDNAQGIGP